MTKEELDKLTPEELYKLPEEVVLKYYIKTTEERYISYKQMLESMHKDKIVYEPGDWRIEFGVWFKEHLRERKNYEEGNLKRLHTELKYGGELPFWLKEKKEKKTQCACCINQGHLFISE